MNDTLNFLEVMELLDFGVYQLIPEGEDCDGRPKIVCGRYVDVEHQLSQANREGAAVFVQVQGGRARGKDHIPQVRWLLADFDNHTDLPDLPFVPHVVVRTRRGYHAYWRIEHSTDLALWSAVQKKMQISLGSCAGARQLSQCMRVPGFYHQKAERFLVKIHGWNPSGPDYQLERFADRYGASVANSPEESAYEPLAGKWDFRLLRYWLRRLLKDLRMAVEGSRFVTLQTVAFQMGCYATVGLEAERAKGAMREIVSSWKEYNHQEGYRTIDSCFQKGYEHAWKYPPHTPPAQIAAFERRDQRSALEDRIKAKDEAGTLGCPITVSTLMGQHPEWPNAYVSERSARQGLGKVLRELGYDSKRRNKERYYVKATENLDANAGRR